MRKWCAYHMQNFGCEKFMGEVDGMGVEGDTSGLCEECLKIELEKMKEGKAPVLCLPVEAKPKSLAKCLVPGVVTLNCTDCQREIFVSPSTMDIIKSGKAYPLCPSCFIAAVGSLAPMVTPAWLREIKEYYRRN
jgi:hypothetical protein